MNAHEPRTQAECDRHNARRARAYAKAAALRAAADGKASELRAIRERRDAQARPLGYGEQIRVAQEAFLAASKAARAAESRAEAIPFATMEICDEFGSRC